MTGHAARAETLVDAPPEVVWDVLTSTGSDPRIMFGAEVTTDWVPGSPITWRGDYQGATFEDRGVVVAVERPRLLTLTHYSPMSGQPDVPESYHTLTYTLVEEGAGTRVTLEQDNNDSAEAAEHAADSWRAMLEGVKGVAEEHHGS